MLKGVLRPHPPGMSASSPRGSCEVRVSAHDGGGARGEGWTIPRCSSAACKIPGRSPGGGAEVGGCLPRTPRTPAPAPHRRCGASERRVGEFPIAASSPRQSLPSRSDVPPWRHPAPAAQGVPPRARRFVPLPPDQQQPPLAGAGGQGGEGAWGEGMQSLSPGPLRSPLSPAPCWRRTAIRPIGLNTRKQAWVRRIGH
jgi:hypothetical protein